MQLGGVVFLNYSWNWAGCHGGLCKACKGFPVRDSVARGESPSMGQVLGPAEDRFAPVDGPEHPPTHAVRVQGVRK